MKWIPPLACAFVLAASVSAEELVRYDAQPASKVRMEGTSTIHDWTVEGQLIGGYLELGRNVAIDPSQKTIPGLQDGKVPAKAQAIIPVRSLKSGKTSMDNVMQEAMKAQQNPRIEYKLLELTPREHAPGTPFQFDAKGTLTVAGVTRTNSMVVNMDKAGPSRLKTTGSTTLKMTDFGIKPPAPALAIGLIKTGDDVKIFFEWLTAVPEGGVKK